MMSLSLSPCCLLSVAAVALCVMSAVNCRTIRWVPNTDYNNPSHWLTGHVPCHNERVHFPPSTTSIFVQHNNTVLEIVLPNDGVLVLGDGVVLSFPSAPDNDATCVEKETVFNGSRPLSWFDGANWCEIDDVNSDTCLSHPSRRLHVESVPCGHDDVVFPSASGFAVDLEAHADIRVNAIRIGSLQLDRSRLVQFMNSDAGRRQFFRNSTSGRDTVISITGRGQCSDVTGCFCDNDQLLNHICAIQSAQCRPLSCNNALLPQGHCCSICGAVLVVQFRPGFTVDALENLIKDSYQQPTDGEVWWITSKIRGAGATADYFVLQVVVSDESDGQQAVIVANRLHSTLLNGKDVYKVTDVQFTATESINPSSLNQELHGGQLAAAIVVPMIGAILLAALVCVVVFTFCSRRTPHEPRFNFPTLPSVSFWRRSATEGREDMELGRRSGVVFDNRVVFDSNLTSFDNVTFGKEPLSLQEFEQLDVQPAGIRAGFNNPMYGTAPLQENVAEKRSPPAQSTFSVSSQKSDAETSEAVTEAVQHPAAVENLYANMESQHSSTPPRPTTTPGDDDFKKSRLPSLFHAFRSDGRQPLKEEPVDDNVAMGDDRRDIAQQKPVNVEDKAEKKKRAGKAPRKGTGSGIKSSDRHQRFENEENSEEDTLGENIETKQKKSGTKGPTVEKGFGNPCFDVDVPTISSPTRPAIPEASQTIDTKDTGYKTGFTNPLFNELQGRVQEVKLKDAETGDSEA